MATTRRSFLKSLLAAGVAVADANRFSSFFVPSQYYNKRFGVRIPLAKGWEITSFLDPEFMIIGDYARPEHVPCRASQVDALLAGAQYLVN